MIILAQTNGLDFSWVNILVRDVFQTLFITYGPIPTIMIFMIVAIFMLWRDGKKAEIRRGNAETERQNAQTEQTELINERFKKTGDELTLVYKELIDSKQQQGVLEGRVIELGNMLRHDREKYEVREKAWDNDRRSMNEKIDSLSKESQSHKDQIETLQKELDGKKSELQNKQDELKAIFLENDNLKSMIEKRDIRIKALEAELLQLQDTLKEQAEQIKLLAEQLAKLDPPKTEVELTITEALNPTTQPLPELDITKQLPEIEDNDS